MRYLILTMFFLCVMQSSFAQTTAIADINFEQALISLGLDSGLPDGAIVTDSINTLTNLDVSHSGISDLSGIEDFTSLELLICNNNQLTTINLSSNIHLVHLLCYSNNISNLDLSNNAELLSIECAFNALTTIDFTHNPKLTHVEISSNNISTLDFSANPLLHVLYCDSNGLTYVDVTQNPLLFYFNCVENDITTLDLSNCVNLNYLYVSANNIEQLELSQNDLLVDLFCEENQIQTLNLAHCLDLNWLIADDNNLYCLNVKNGFNSDILGISTTNNPSLSCITADDPAYSTLNWTNIDPTASYSTNCGNCILSLDQATETYTTIYPNPVTNGIIQLKNITPTAHYTIYNSTGQLLKEGIVNHTIDVAGYASGIYFLKIRTDIGIHTKQFIIN